MTFGVDVIASLVLMPFLIHSLGDRGYGMWAIVGTIVGQFGLLDLGLASTTQRFMANALGRNADDEVSSVYTTSIILFWIIGVAALLVTVALLPFVPMWFSSDEDIFVFRWALFLAGVNIAIGFPFSALYSVFWIKLRNDIEVANLVFATVTRLALVYAAVKLGYGVVGVALAMLVGAVLSRIAMGISKQYIAPEVRFRMAYWSAERAKELIKFGRYIFLIRLGDTARNRLDNLLVAPILGLAAVTHYSVATRLADYFQILVIRIMALPGPVFASHAGRGDSASIRTHFLLVSGVGALLCGVVAVSILLFGHRFIELWLGPGFDDSYRAVVPLVIGLTVLLLQAPSRDVLGAIYRHAFDAKSNLVESIANIVLTIALVQEFGIFGAALGTALPMVIIKGIFLPRYVCQQIEIPISTYVWTILPPVGMASFVGLIGFVVLPIGNIDSLLLLFTVAALFSVVLGIAAFFMLSRQCRGMIWTAVVTSFGARGR